MFDILNNRLVQLIFAIAGIKFMLATSANSDWLSEPIMIASVVGVIIYNEFKQNKQLSVLDLIGLREEVHSLNTSQQLLAQELSHKATDTQFALLESNQEHLLARDEFLAHKEEIVNEIREADGKMREIASMLQMMYSGMESEHEEESEEEQTIPEPKSTKTRKR